jgi:hypothetical protein
MNVGVADPDRAVRRPIDPREQVQQRRLAGAGWPHQAEEIAFRYRDRHAIEHGDLERVALVRLGDVTQLDQHLRIL